MVLGNRSSLEGLGDGDSEEGDGYGEGEGGWRSVDPKSPLSSGSSARDDCEDRRLGAGDREEDGDSERGVVFAVDVLEGGPNGGDGERV